MTFAEQEIHEIATSVWAAFFQVPIEPAPRGDSPRTSQMVGRVTISGGWEGSVSVEFPPELASLLAGQMLMCEVDELTDEDVQDAVGEIVNMVGGNLKTRLDAGCNLGLPDVRTDGTTPDTSAEVVNDVSFNCQGQPLRVTVRRARAA